MSRYSLFVANFHFLKLPRKSIPRRLQAFVILCCVISCGFVGVWQWISLMWNAWNLFLRLRQPEYALKIRVTLGKI